MWDRWREPLVLAGLAGACAAAWMFIELAEEVVAGEVRAADARLLMLLRNPADPADPLGPRWLELMARDLTALGSLGVLGLLVLAAAGFLALAGRRRTALFVLAATGGGALASTLLKALFARPRPDIVPHEIYVASASFPSGHAMVSAVVYLTLGALMARLAPGLRLKVYILALAVLLVGLVGISRVYLGVHWPSDVLAGWAAGAGWAFACGAAAQALHISEGRA
jgi:undecaprenyl-diphosphatase